MSLNNVEICSAALAMIGANPISSLTDGTTEAEICAALYDRTVENQLSIYRWRFASNQVQLNRLSLAPAAGRWDAAYQIPGDVLVVSTIRVGGSPIPFERMGDNIYCNAGEQTEVYLEGVYKPSEEMWPPYFVRLIELLMASQLAQSLAERTDLANMLDAKAARQAAVARNMDSQARTARRIRATRFTARRHARSTSYDSGDYA